MVTFRNTEEMNPYVKHWWTHGMTRACLPWQELQRIHQMNEHLLKIVYLLKLL